MWSDRGSSDDTVSRPGAGRPENCGSNLGRGKILSGLQNLVGCACSIQLDSRCNVFLSVCGHMLGALGLFHKAVSLFRG